jgi:hypothetical protein
VDDDKIRAETIRAVARVSDMTRRQDDLATAVGRMTMAAADVEIGLGLLVEAVVGERALVLTERAPASAHLQWIRVFSDDSLAIPLARAREVKDFVKRIEKVLHRRNKLVHATWLQLNDGRYAHLSLKRSGDGLEGGHVGLDEIYDVEAELLECASQLRELRSGLTGHWGGEHAPSSREVLDVDRLAAGE